MSDQIQAIRLIVDALEIVGGEYDVVTVKFEGAPHNDTMFFIEVDRVPELTLVLELTPRGKQIGARMVLNTEIFSDLPHAVETLAINIRRALALIL